MTTAKQQGRLYGYARVSTAEQNEGLQNEALKKAGCTQIYTDKTTGSTTKREQLQTLLEGIKKGFIIKGDSVVIWKLDRLSRNIRDLLEIKDLLDKYGINLVSITENFDTRTPTGKMMLSMIGIIAEMERDTIRERVQAGVQNAIKNGVRFGKPRFTFTQAQIDSIHRRKAEGETYRAIAKSMKISYDTIYKYLVKPKLEAERVKILNK